MSEASSKILRTANAPKTSPDAIEMMVAQALLDLENNVADLKAELRPLQISAAREVDVKVRFTISSREGWGNSYGWMVGVLGGSERCREMIGGGNTDLAFFWMLLLTGWKEGYCHLRPRSPNQGFPQDPESVS